MIYTSVVRPGTFGTQIGLLTGDTVRTIASAPVDNADQALKTLRAHAGQSVEVVVTRPTSDDPITLHGVVPSMAAALQFQHPEAEPQVLAAASETVMRDAMRCVGT